MTQTAKNRTHKKAAEQLNSRLNPEQVRRNKTEKTKARNFQKKKTRAIKVKEMLAKWRKLSLEEQLEQLKKRPGNSQKQTQKILDKIAQITKVDKTTEDKDNGQDATVNNNIKIKKKKRKK